MHTRRGQIALRTLHRAEGGKAISCCTRDLAVSAFFIRLFRFWSRSRKADEIERYVHLLLEALANIRSSFKLAA
jgi:hypothetical protein